MWPDLPYSEWNDTKDTLHMWMQIVGKVKLALSPFINQWWEVAFSVTSFGMTTGEIPYNGELFQIDFDFLKHVMVIHTSWDQTETLELTSYTVSEFYKKFLDMLETCEIKVHIWPMPVEVSHPIPFLEDTTHASYDKENVERWWRILEKVDIAFEQFRTSFCGKNSPVLFFWGSFDLTGTRFSGKKADPPKLDGVMGKIMRYAENEENFAFGFWPGDERFPWPAFYSYMYPKPPGMESITLAEGASFNEQLGECILPYDDVRKAEHPEKVLMNFLESIYRECATLAKWDINSFRTEIPSV